MKHEALNIYHSIDENKRHFSGLALEHVELVLEALGTELDRYDSHRLHVAEQRVKQLEAQLADSRNGKLEAALQRIARWHGEFPATSQVWENGAPMEYGHCWGSNGERDYMRQVALDALKIDTEA